MVLRYDGRVAVVTGAGRGIGRLFALFLASRGAKVVVNDYGTSVKGDGSAENVAQEVVAEIISSGGVAVADAHSVVEGDKIIETAINVYGRVDILINNAGISNVVKFDKLTPQNWNKMIDTHLYGAFKCTKAVWNHMKQQNYGRIVNSSSLIGLYGYVGHADYSTAKSGLNGFTKSLAIEGAKNNIFTNSFCPLAATRMMAPVQATNKKMFDIIDSKLIVPIVAILAHESCKQNGSIFECGGGWFSKVRWQRSQGYHFDPETMSPEAVAANFDKIISFQGHNEYPVYDSNRLNKIKKYTQRSKL